MKLDRLELQELTKLRSQALRGDKRQSYGHEAKVVEIRICKNLRRGSIGADPISAIPICIAARSGNCTRTLIVRPCGRTRGSTVEWNASSSPASDDAARDSEPTLAYAETPFAGDGEQDDDTGMR